ncbi:hypothetical protein Tco_0629832, partial [Tanacetum coccineum]
MDLENTQNNSLAKLPLLKQGEYDTWRLRIESYIQLQDYTLWEIIEECNSFKPVGRTTANEDGTYTTTIPDVDVKSLFEAIEARFGGNEATKKTQKTLLKLQKIVSQLTILGEIITPEDLNLKFLRSLPTEWGMHVVVWRNKSDLGSISCDDLYNNFKIVEPEVKRSVTSSPNSASQNLAFVSVSTASTNNSTTCLSDVTVYAYLATQPNGSQVVHEDLEQIHEDDLDEMDLKWQLALLSMKARKFYQRTGKKIIINGSDTAGYDKKKVECFNLNVEESSSKAMLAIDGTGFDWSYMADEEASTNFALMAFSDSEIDVLKRDASFNELDINGLKKQVERLKKEKEDNQFKIDNFENASKSLDQLIGNQISDNNKKGMVQKPFLNNVRKGTGQKEVRPVWTNAMRVNHQNFSNSKRNFAPTAVLTKSGLVPFSTARENFSRTAAPVSAARPFNAAVHKPFANSVNTAKGKRMTSAVGKQGINWCKPTLTGHGDPKIMVFNSPCFTANSWLVQDQTVLALATPGQTETGKESSNPFMAGSLPKTINSNNVDEESQKIERQAPVMISDAEEYLISEDPVKQGRMERYIFEEVYRKIMLGANTARLLINFSFIKMENLECCDKHNIVNWEYILLGMTEAKDSEVCKITRADGSSSFHGDIQALLRRLDRQDLRQLYSLVQERFKDHPLEGHDLDLWGDLRMLFDPNEEDDIWLNQQYWELLRWKLHEYSGVHSLFLDGTSIQINMLVEKKYPLKKEILEKMINLKIEAEEESAMAHELIKFIKSQIAEQMVHDGDGSEEVVLWWDVMMWHSGVDCGCGGRWCHEDGDEGGGDVVFASAAGGGGRKPAGTAVTTLKNEKGGIV